MPYFSEYKVSPYYCPRCKAWFLPGGVSCCVLHGPGTCCHMGETLVGAPDPIKKDPHDP